MHISTILSRHVRAKAKTLSIAQKQVVKNPAAVALGSIKSEKKSKSSKENGKKGGRPKKESNL